uniref:Uncharacterized protein n=1 Tax=Aegilops tauschii subsp. strangulata TaxID=200361 RepID=A0A452ZEB2_AEGTS
MIQNPLAKTFTVCICAVGMIRTARSNGRGKSRMIHVARGGRRRAGHVPRHPICPSPLPPAKRPVAASESAELSTRARSLEPAGFALGYLL